MADSYCNGRTGAAPGGPGRPARGLLGSWATKRGCLASLLAEERVARDRFGTGIGRSAPVTAGAETATVGGAHVRARSQRAGGLTHPMGHLWVWGGPLAMLVLGPATLKARFDTFGRKW